MCLLLIILFDLHSSISEISLVQREAGSNSVRERYLAVLQIKKHSSLSVEVKMKILKEVDDKVVSKTEISQKCGISKNSLLTIVKNLWS